MHETYTATSRPITVEDLIRGRKAMERASQLDPGNEIYERAIDKYWQSFFVISTPPIRSNLFWSTLHQKEEKMNKEERARKANDLLECAYISVNDNTCRFWEDEYQDLCDLLNCEVKAQPNYELYHINGSLWYGFIKPRLEQIANETDTGEAGENTNRSEEMSDYTQQVESQLKERNNVTKKIEKTRFEILLDIKSSVSDLAGIHTDDDGNLDRGALGVSLDQALATVAFQSEDLVPEED